jgi:hypothetical protein
MKPLNLDNKPCSPISSNCVVWQGPDIPCIKLCTGDTVSDVVSAMATELCTILDTLKVSNYDLTCFNLQACGPEDFQALIQFLITKICELEGVTPETKDIPTCPDCVVSVAECFVTGTQTTMQLVDYVQLIGEKICNLITEIGLIQAQITDILIRVTALENAPIPTFTLPTFSLGCTVGSLTGEQDIDIVLIEFINNVWCPFYAETGSTAELNAAGNQKCIDDTDVQLNTGTAFSTNPNWILDANYGTLADAVNNIWVVLCDVWNYTSNNPIITVADTPTVDLELSLTNELTANITDTGWVDLEGFAFMTAPGVKKPACRRIGNVIHFRGQVYIPLDKGGVVVPLAAANSYNGETGVTPFQGAGGVTLTPSDQITFNNNASVIPTGILNLGESIDENYFLDSPTLIERPFVVGGASSRLFGLGRVLISDDGKLILATNNSFESAPGSAGPILLGSSSVRFLTSNVTIGELIPDFTATKSNVTSFPVNPTWSSSAAYNVGDIVSHSGALYQSYINISAPGPNPAPDVTPTAWSPYVDDVRVDVTTTTYPFTCNAGDRSQLGGFYFIIDGLTCFV